MKRRGEIEFPDANHAENVRGEGRGTPTGFQF